MSENIIDISPQNYFLNFNKKSGLLHVQSGVLLSDIINLFINEGWFLGTTPGTKYVTVGGAIAADVHGKNHHIDGCFSEFLHSFNLMLPNGQVKECSPQKNKSLFRSTCGGMGLTGVILDVKLYMKKVKSTYVNQITEKGSNIDEIFKIFEKYKEIHYSVAWIDCLSRKNKLGRGIFLGGSFDDDGMMDYKNKRKINIPFYFPSFSLNKYTVKAFNWLYYNKTFYKTSKKRVNFDKFFYPLDGINNWNRIYGRNGFTQYQFILPLEKSFQGMQEILRKIADSGKGSFLAVLKLYGDENKNYLSFPMKGYSLALDFKIEKGLFSLLDELDEIVNNYGGRIYLAKDVRIKQKSFENGYPRISKFREIRDAYGFKEKINSFQSRRVGI